VLIIAVAVILVLFILDGKKNEDDTKEDAGNEVSTEAVSEDSQEEFGQGVEIEDGTTEEASTETTPEAGTETIDYSQTYILSYDGFDVEVPEYWRDKVTVEEVDTSSHFGYITFHQTASYDSNLDGEIATICWYLDADDTYTELPAYKLLGTGNGKNYVMTYPTDVRYDYENQTVAEEYSSLTAGLYVLEEGFTVTSASTDMQFVFPDSDSRNLTQAELDKCTDMELRVAKNELYARRGRIFEKEPFVTYFNELSWYNGYISPDDFADSNFNSVEQYNKDLIVAALSARGLN
jgi:hypothetical protein